jgi:hypothetical protein
MLRIMCFLLVVRWSPWVGVATSDVPGSIGGYSAGVLSGRLGRIAQALQAPERWPSIGAGAQARPQQPLPNREY